MKVLLTVPNKHWIHKMVNDRVFRLLMDKRYDVTYRPPSHTPYENNLHHIVRNLLKDGFNYWLNIDADNPPTNNPLDLLELDRDILGFPTPIWHYTCKEGERPYYWNAYDYVEKSDAYREHLPQHGLQKVDAIGSGCMLVARRVFEDPEMQKAPFERKLHPTGEVNKGTDLSFSERARKRGFEIWAHYNYPCSHFVEIDLLEMIKAFQALMEKQKNE